MPNVRGGGARVARWMMALAAAVTMTACAGPETRDDLDPTPVPTITPTPTETPPPTPTTAPTVAPAATPEATATPMPTSTPEAAASPAGSPVAADADLSAQLPELTDLPGEGYVVAEEGARTAQDLANFYADPTPHLQRLEEWGFRGHVFRAFLRDPAGPDDPLPSYVLTTINEYGSPEQAESALQWLKQLQTTLGATEVEAPQIGDSAVAITLPTAEGVPTASLYVRRGATMYVYFAQGGDPLAAVNQIAGNVLTP